LQYILYLTLTADSNTVNEIVECLELMRSLRGTKVGISLQWIENHSAALTLTQKR